MEPLLLPVGQVQAHAPDGVVAALLRRTEGAEAGARCCARLPLVCSLLSVPSSCPECNDLERAVMESPFKGRSGWLRLWNALQYSRAGLRASWQNEAAFRQEVCLALVLIPLALWWGGSGIERALLVASVVLVLIVELINSALEAVVDRISLEQHPLAGRAKDIGSAAVLLALLNAVLVWALVLLG
jgi:diacylglycerol kinase (ATP)